MSLVSSGCMNSVKPVNVIEPWRLICFSSVSAKPSSFIIKLAAGPMLECLNFSFRVIECSVVGSSSLFSICSIPMSVHWFVVFCISLFSLGIVVKCSSFLSTSRPCLLALKFLGLMATRLELVRLDLLKSFFLDVPRSLGMSRIFAIIQAASSLVISFSG